MAGVNAFKEVFQENHDLSLEKRVAQLESLIEKLVQKIDQQSEKPLPVKETDGKASTTHENISHNFDLIQRNIKTTDSTTIHL